MNKRGKRDKYSVQKNSNNLGRYSSLNCPHLKCKLPFKEYEKGKKKSNFTMKKPDKHCISKETGKSEKTVTAERNLGRHDD